MGKIKKTIFIFLIVGILVLYVAGAIFVNEEYILNEKNLNNQVLLYSSRKKDAEKKKSELLSLRESLINQMDGEISRENNLKASLEQQKELENQRKIIEEQKRLDELRKQEELRMKSEQAKRRVSRAS